MNAQHGLGHLVGEFLHARAFAGRENDSFHALGFKTRREVTDRPAFDKAFVRALQVRTSFTSSLIRVVRTLEGESGTVWNPSLPRDDRSAWFLPGANRLFLERAEPELGAPARPVSLVAPK